MKDTRRERQALVVLVSAGIGAVVGQFYVGPWLAKQLNVRKK